MKTNRSVELTEFADAFVDMIDEYSEEVRQAVNQQTKENGIKLKDLVKDKAPVDTGKYKRAIAVKDSGGLRGMAGATVYVKSPHYRLAHLLERPHALRGGGLSKPQPHFGPALKKIEPIYLKGVKEAIEGID